MQIVQVIPGDLKKIQIIDRWYHKEYLNIEQPQVNDTHLRTTYRLNKSLSSDLNYMDTDGLPMCLDTKKKPIAISMKPMARQQTKYL